MDAGQATRDLPRDHPAHEPLMPSLTVERHVACPGSGSTPPNQITWKDYDTLLMNAGGLENDTFIR